MLYLRLTFESLRFAFQAIKSNIFRTILSLLGVTIGIFSIIGVYTMVDSLERNIKNSLSNIGDKTIYVDKFPWQFGGEDYPWWRYFRRPRPNYAEFKYLKDNLKYAKGVTMMDFNVTPVRRESNSYNALCEGVTYDFNSITEVPIIAGRYFTPGEIEAGRNVVIIGGELANALFLNEDALGKQIKIKGENFSVIGVQEMKGKQMVDIGGNPDQKAYIPFIKSKRMFSSGKLYGTIAIQAFESDLKMNNLESEITGRMRTIRGLHPLDENNFALNKPEAAANFITQIFGSLRIGGFVIGLFALLIGGFGIANIMFVSVSERTNIIGIQKSLGAKNEFILFQFLFEAIFLCLLGGLFGILIVFGLSFIKLGSLELVLSPANIIFGLFISSLIGILAGIIPASKAANMNPVEAIRSK